MRLVNNIIKDINETTTGADISYIPSQLGVIVPKLYTLSKLKKQWKLTFLPDVNETTVNFEDLLKIKVKNLDMQHFLENVLHLTTIPMDSVVNLTKYLSEAFNEDINNSYGKLKGALLDLIASKPISVTDLNFHTWVYYLGAKSYNTPKDVLIRLERFNTDLDFLIANLQKEVGEDKGLLDLITDTIESRGAINKYLIFKDYKYLVGSMVQSNLYGVDLVYNTMVDMSYRIQENVQILNNEELLGGVGAYRGMKVAGNNISPIGGVFGPKFFNFLADTIKDTVTD